MEVLSSPFMNQVNVSLAIGVQLFSTSLFLEWLEVRGEIGPEGWNALGRSMRARPGLVRSIETDRAALFGPLGGPYNGATVEDLRVIWDQLMPRGNMVVHDFCRGHFTDFHDRFGDGGEEAWLQLLDFSLEDLAFCCEECTPIL